jgi:hypothetical protein
MKSKGIKLLIFVLLFAVLVPVSAVCAEKGYAIKGFIGKSSTQAASNTTVELLDGKTGEVIDGMTTNFFGKYSFSGLQPGVYILQVGDIQKKVYLKEKNVRMDIDLSAKDGTMDYVTPLIKEHLKPLPSGSEASSGQGNNKSNDTTLASQIAGTWWGYSGSTERKIGLCADGSYMDYTESSYSGSSYDSGGSETMSWGSASQGGGAGSWVIQGDTQSGTIYVTYNNGSQMTLNYQQCGESGCLLFNGNKLCRSSGSCRE